MWIEKLTGSLEQKRRFKQNQARLDALPTPYGAAAKALQRYLWYGGGIVDGETLLKMQGDFVDLWERAAADETPVRAIVGDDPVDFVEQFVAAYTGRKWIDKERQRLVEAIDAAAAQQASTGLDTPDSDRR